MKNTFTFPLSVLLIVSLFSNNAYPMDASERWKQLNQELKALVLAQKKTESKKNNSLTVLKTIDKKIGLRSEQLSILTKEINKNESLLTNLETQQKTLEKENKAQSLLLEKHLINAYEMGRYPVIKLFLNQENPQVINRLASYYSYINKARFDLLKALQDNQEKIRVMAEEKEETIKSLTSLKEKKLSEQKKLQDEQSHQSQFVKELRRTIENQMTKIAYVKKSKEELEDVLKRLPQKASPKPHAPFSRMQYKLSWPASGLLNDLFGQTIRGTNLKYNGIEILADEKKPVYAVYPGVVVFSDWLRGFGLMTIIDHGLGYMTLYAHNQSLLKEQGEPVEMGEQIATVGHSGGQLDSGVYFEIRRNGRPIDPLRWLKPE